MSRYYRYLLAILLLQPVAFLLAPVLVFFAKTRDGWSFNGSMHAVEPRLPDWLGWYEGKARMMAAVKFGRCG